MHNGRPAQYSSISVVAMARLPQILLLTANQQYNALLREALSSEWSLTWAKDKTEFQKLLHAGDYDVILCDALPTGWTWQGALEAVRELHSTLPLIVLSDGELRGGQEWVRALQAGAFDLLQVPDDHDSLIAVLDRALFSQRSRQESGKNEGTIRIAF
jgi:DNA-binding NtrC family response regulator